MSTMIFPEYEEYLKHYFKIKDRVMFLASNIEHTNEGCFDWVDDEVHFDIDEDEISVSWETYHCCGTDYHRITFPTSYLGRDIVEINSERDMEYQSKMAKLNLEKKAKAEETERMTSEREIKILRGLMEKYPDVTFVIPRDES